MFIPGTLLKTFKSKSGKEITLRFPKWEDLDLMLAYINALSKEDTFISIGEGKEVTRKEQIAYLTNVFSQMEQGDMVQVIACYNDQLIGISEITRITKGIRQKHVGIIGISIAKEYRGDGIGKTLITTVLEEAKKIRIRLVKLTVYSLNEQARRLYATVGFAEGGVIPGAILYKGDYIDEVHLYKKLV